jgi:hypothetical protein
VRGAERNDREISVSSACSMHASSARSHRTVETRVEQPLAGSQVLHRTDPRPKKTFA